MKAQLIKQTEMSGKVWWIIRFSDGEISIIRDNEDEIRRIFEDVKSGKLKTCEEIVEETEI